MHSLSFFPWSVASFRPLASLIKPRLGDFLFYACLKPTLHSRKFLVTVPAGASRNRVTPPSAKFVVAFITPARTFPRVKFYFPPAVMAGPSTLYTRADRSRSASTARRIYSRQARRIRSYGASYIRSISVGETYEGNGA